jgi:hypothetical protein
MPRICAFELRGEDELIARLDRLAEARLVDADEEETREFVRDHVGGDEREQPAVCASASMIMTPGMTGRCGKCPGRTAR